MNGTARWFAVSALAFALAGCGTFKSVGDTVGGWFGGSGGNTLKPAPLTELAPGVELKAVWQADVGAADAGLFEPAASADAVYAAGAKSAYRLGLDSGKPAWRADGGVALSGGVGVGAQLLLAGNKRGELVAYAADTGTVRWTAKLTSELADPPLVIGDIVVARTGDGLVRGLAVATGERVWQYSRGLPPLALRGSGGMSARDGVLYVGFPGGKLIALDAAKGAQLWEATVALPRGATELERIADVMGAPLVDDSRVCAAAYQGRVACFDRKDGTPLWARDASTHAGIAADPSYLYLVDDADAVVQHDIDNGRAGWRQDKLAHRKLTAPLVFERWIVVGDAEGYVHVLSREDGSLVARARADGPIVATPITIGPGFAVQTLKGGVFAYRIK